MKYCLPDMALFNAGNAVIAGSAGNESAGNGRIAGTDELQSRASLNDETTFLITPRLPAFPALLHGPLPAFTAIPAFTACLTKPPGVLTTGRILVFPLDQWLAGKPW